MNAEVLAIPQDWDQITPAWMTAALARSHPGAQVESVQVQLRDDGTNRRARLALTYAAGSGPATVFVKAADPAHKELIRAGDLWQRPDIAIALAQRYSAAYADLDTATAIEALNR